MIKENNGVISDTCSIPIHIYDRVANWLARNTDILTERVIASDYSDIYNSLDIYTVDTSDGVQLVNYHFSSLDDYAEPVRYYADWNVL